MRWLWLLLLTVPLSAQVVHTFGALDSNNLWTGTDEFLLGAQVGPKTFANLPAETDGTVIYCPDCQAVNPCAGSGGGAFAFGIAGAWSCTLGGGGGSVTGSGLNGNVAVWTGTSSIGYGATVPGTVTLNANGIAGAGVLIEAANGSASAGGGSATLFAGNGSAAAKPGGSTTIGAGDGGTGGVGGNLVLTAGLVSSGTGTAGNVNIGIANHGTATSGGNIIFSPTNSAGHSGALMFTNINVNNDNYGELQFAGAATQSYTFIQPYLAHPTCTATPEFSATQPWITYSGSSPTFTMTINFSGSVTGFVGYHCWGIHT